VPVSAALAAVDAVVAEGMSPKPALAVAAADAAAPDADAGLLTFTVNRPDLIVCCDVNQR